MVVKKLIHDNGNSIVKSRNDNNEVDYPHAMHRLTMAEWQHLKARGGNKIIAKDYALINGTPYAFGQEAERYGRITRRVGAQKYTEDYYGVFMAYSAARLWQNSGQITVYGSHAPGDIDYRENLIDATGKFWEVEIEDRCVSFEVVYVNTYEEPLGGVMNLVLAADGEHYDNVEINNGRTLVVDIGGGTCDFFAVNPNGEPDYTVNWSELTGINQVIDDFTKAFRANNAKVLRTLQAIPPEQIREAIRTRVFKGGGRDIPCTEEVDSSVNLLINRIDTAYQRRAGGPIPWSNIVLTGGGVGLIESQLRDVLDHSNIYMAERPDKIHLANIRGGLKMCRMWVAGGMWYDGR